MSQNKIKKIYPRGPLYITALILGTFFSLVCGTTIFIYDLCQINKGSSLTFFKSGSTTNCIIEAFIFLILGITLFYFLVLKMFLSECISFNGNNLVKKKKHLGFGDTLPALYINCGETASAYIKIKIYTILTLKTNQNIDYKIFIAPFSRKQINNIIHEINLRGGAIDEQEMARYLKEEYLFGKRKPRKKNKKDRSN